MEAIEIKPMDDRIIISIDKDAADSDFLMNLFDRLRTEELIKKAEFNPKILELSQEIKKNWWKRNREKFLEEPE